MNEYSFLNIATGVVSLAIIFMLIFEKNGTRLFLGGAGAVFPAAATEGVEDEKR